MTRDKAQERRFREAARELGCDDDPKAFEKMFGQIVPPKIGSKISKRAEIKPSPKKQGDG
jgi:hypothetical protein